MLVCAEGVLIFPLIVSGCDTMRRLCVCACVCVRACVRACVRVCGEALNVLHCLVTCLCLHVLHFLNENSCRHVCAQLGHSVPYACMQIFRQFDVDLAGAVSRNEFKHALACHNVELSKEEADALCQAVGRLCVCVCVYTYIYINERVCRVQ